MIRNLHSLFSRHAGALALAVVAAPALAQAPGVEAPGVSGAAIMQMLLGLTLIIAILFFGAYALRKLNGGKGFGQGGPLRIVGALTLSARERIVLVEVGDSWLVVGIVPGQIKTLHTLAKGQLPEPGGEKPFGQWLKQMTERKHESR